jgi:hypothetical protein
VADKHGLLSQLSKCRRAKATRGVDKLYGLYGISNDHSNVIPDHMKSEEEVYLEYATKLMRKGAGKPLFYETAIADRRSERLPSWAPDWSSIPTRMNLGQQWSKTGKWLFKAGGMQSASGPKARLVVNGRVLITVGYMLQTIVILGKPEDREFPNTPNLEHILNVMRDMDRFRGLLKGYPTGESVDMVFSRILETDQPRNQDNCTSAVENNEHRDIMLQPELETVPSNAADVVTQKVLRMSRYDPRGLKNIARTIPGRRLGITDKSYA